MGIMRCRKCNYKFNHPETRGEPRACPYCNAKGELVHVTSGNTVRDVDDIIKELE